MENAIGDQLKSWRRRAGLSQETLAARLGHKRPTTVLAWEKGRRTPKAKTIRHLAQILDASAADVMKALDALAGIASTTPRAARHTAKPEPLHPLAAATVEWLAADPTEPDLAYFLHTLNFVRMHANLRAVPATPAHGRGPLRRAAGTT